MENNDVTKKPTEATITNPSKKSAISFWIVSISVVLIHFLVFFALMKWTSIYPVWANTFAFLVAFCLSLATHFTLTFNRDTKKGEWFKNLFKILVVLITGFSIHQTLFVMGIEKFGDERYMLIWGVVMAILVALFMVISKALSFVVGTFRGLTNPEKPQTPDSKLDD